MGIDVVTLALAKKSGGGGTAENILYDNNESGMLATTVQEAIDELTCFFSTTLVKDDWIADGNRFKQTRPLPGIITEYPYLIDLNLSEATTVEEEDSLQRAFSLIYRSAATNQNEITVWATEAPSINITITIVR